MRLKISLAAFATIGVVAFVGFRIAGDHADGATESAAAPAMMAMPVPVVSVVKKTLPIYLEYPGRIESIRSIALQARASGYIESQLAPDGADVKTGDLLYQIDPRDLQAALDLANAQAQRDQASLEYARANFGRGEELVKSGFVTKDAYDQRASAMHQAEAALVADRAAIETREAKPQLRRDHRPIFRPTGAQPGGEEVRWSVRRAGRSTRWFSLIPFMSASTPASRIWSRSRRLAPQAKSTPRSRSPANLMRSARAN